MDKGGARRVRFTIGQRIEHTRKPLRGVYEADGGDGFALVTWDGDLIQSVVPMSKLRPETQHVGEPADLGEL